MVEWTSDDYTYCIYCGELFPLLPPEGEARHDKQAPDGEPCPYVPSPAQSEDDEHPYHCYSCGVQGTSLFSKSQCQKYEWKARCKSCVTSHQSSHGFLKRRPQRFAPFAEKPKDNSPSGRLPAAIGSNDVVLVNRLLSLGADPNRSCQLYKYDISFSHPVCHIYVWTKEGKPVLDEDLQPKYPLDLVLFKTNDVTYGRAEQMNLGRIAELLINAGAKLDEYLDSDSEVYLETHGEWEKIADYGISYQVIGAAMQSIRRIRKQCQELEQAGKVFDFPQYFRRREGRDGLWVDRRANGPLDFVLSEMAIYASSDLFPYYKKYVHASGRSPSGVTVNKNEPFTPQVTGS